MIVTEKFVFVHLPRCAGTFVTEVLKKFYPSAREVGYHLPLAVLPNEFSHLPVLGTVRNPWAFYASWFHHHNSDRRYLPLFCSLSGNRNLGFVQTTLNALNLSMSNEKLDLVIQELSENFDYRRRHVSNLTKDVMGKIRGSGVGLFTFRFNQLFGDRDDIYFCRVESLRSDLINFFNTIGAATAELETYVLNLEKKNISEHLHYSHYYTAQLAETVLIRDRKLVDRFGYSFERAPV